MLDVYQEFQDEIQLPYPVVSAKVNNVSQGLKFRLYQNRDVEFLDARAGSGHRAYVRSLSFVLYKATQDIFPGSKLFIEHSLCRGYYCNFKKRNNDPLSDEDVDKIRQRMQEIIDLDMPFRRRTCLYRLLHAGRHRRLLLRSARAQCRLPEDMGT